MKDPQDKTPEVSPKTKRPKTKSPVKHPRKVKDHDEKIPELIIEAPQPPPMSPVIPHKIIKVDDASKWRKKIIPEILCVNLQTGNLDVEVDFFWRVWDEHKTDNSWHGWVCVAGGQVTGVLVIQVFVHESKYFRWGPPLSHGALPPDAASGEVKNVAEITLLCAKRCGTKLLELCRR
jgi:hypothetical protein